GAEAVQVAYLAANPGESDAAALRWAGFALMNVVRPRGKSALGLSCGLLGTGMAFRAELLRRVPWRSRGLTEDLEEHVRLAEAGALGRRRLALGLISIVAGPAAFVLGGLALVGAPAEVYRALAHAPALLLDKLGVYARVVRGRGPETWERTPRGERAVA